MTQASKHPWSDAWLLHAVIITAQDGGAELAEVIGAADFLNHAILTCDEINGGVERLVQGGWIRLEDGRLGPRSRATERYEALRDKWRTQVELWEVLLEDEPGAESGPPEQEMAVGPSGPATFSAAEVDRAVEQYLRRMTSR